MSDNFNKNRLAKNTILLYVRMLFTMWLNLYTTRLTLANLGVEDMGIYGVVGSIVSMFAVFSGGMGNAVQRFLTYEIGRDNGDPNKVFCSCLNVIFLLSGIIFILLEVGGLWFLHTKINIPAESMDAAQWVFQISVLTCIVNLISIPYNSCYIDGNNKHINKNSLSDILPSQISGSPLPYDYRQKPNNANWQICRYILCFRCFAGSFVTRVYPRYQSYIRGGY